MCGACMFQMWASALMLKTFQKLLVIMMMTTRGELFEHMFQESTGYA